MSHAFARLAAAVVISSVLSACASISLVDSWHNPAAPPRMYQKLLIASLAKTVEDRRVYEDIVAGELSRLSINAVANHLVATGKNPISRQGLMDAVRRAGAEAVLTIQTTRVERQTDIQPGYVNNWGGGYYPGWDYYGGFRPFGYYGTYGYQYGGYGPATTWYEPPLIYSYDVATIQTNLLDGESGRLVWAATMETLEPGRLVKVGKDLAKEVAQELSKEGLIPNPMR